MDVNVDLTPDRREHGTVAPRRKRPKRWTDTQDFGAMVVRMMRAYGRRVGMADMEDLVQMRELAGLVDEITSDAVKQLRQTGYSWADIGEAMGVTRQAAQQRWGRKP